MGTGTCAAKPSSGASCSLDPGLDEREGGRLTPPLVPRDIRDRQNRTLRPRHKNTATQIPYTAHPTAREQLIIHDSLGGDDLLHKLCLHTNNRARSKMVWRASCTGMCEAKGRYTQLCTVDHKQISYKSNSAHYKSNVMLSAEVLLPV